jgi:hypothetical protein
VAVLNEPAKTHERDVKIRQTESGTAELHVDRASIASIGY